MIKSCLLFELKRIDLDVKGLWDDDPLMVTPAVRGLLNPRKAVYGTYGHV